MSGFGLRAFKKSKEDHTVQEKKQYFQHVVYGENFYAALTYLKLQEKYGAENVKLICENHIDKQSIMSEWRCSLNTVRNENVAKKLMEKKTQLEILPDTHRVKFYKDSKFHEFGGRTKNFEIKPGEEFFQDTFFNIKLEGLFTTEQWENLDETLKSAQLNKYLDRIELTEPTDLIEKTNYILHTGEFESIHCENLYWSESPKDFYSKVENKNKVNDALGELCNTVEHRAAMAVHFEVDGQIYEDKGTVFLPQSVTHEWGHFICDFEDFDPAKNKQNFTCLMFVNEDEVNEEELAKKIRLMKRVLERTIPDFAKMKYDEHIHYDSEFFIDSVKDELVNDIDFDHSHLKFVGQGAPIGAEASEQFKYTPRGIMSILDLLQ